MDYTVIVCCNVTCNSGMFWLKYGHTYSPGLEDNERYRLMWDIKVDKFAGINIYMYEQCCKYFNSPVNISYDTGLNALFTCKAFEMYFNANI